MAWKDLSQERSARNNCNTLYGMRLEDFCLKPRPKILGKQTEHTPSSAQVEFNEPRHIPSPIHRGKGHTDALAFKERRRKKWVRKEKGVIRHQREHPLSQYRVAKPDLQMARIVVEKR
jgi:hypothetical protein